MADIAWEEYSQETGAKRRPRNFRQAMQLNLTDISAGSAVLSLVPSNQGRMLPGFDEIERSRNRSISLVHDAVSVAEQGGDAGTVLSPDLLSRFKKVVPDLQEDESVDFPSALGPNSAFASLTRAARSNIIRAAETPTTKRRASAYFYVPEINKRTSSFEAELVGGTVRKHLNYDDSDFEVLRSAWDSYRTELGVGNPIRIVGTLEFGDQTSVRSIAEIEEIEALEPLDVRARLQHLSSLRDGWFNGKGSVFSRSYLDRLADRFDELYTQGLELPAIYPQSDGTISCEWSFTAGECILTIDPQTDTGEWLDFDPGHDEDTKEREISLSEDSDWRWFCSRVAARAADGRG